MQDQVISQFKELRLLYVRLQRTNRNLQVSGPSNEVSTTLLLSFINTHIPGLVNELNKPRSTADGLYFNYYLKTTGKIYVMHGLNSSGTSQLFQGYLTMCAESSLKFDSCLASQKITYFCGIV
jgi:hypothetical protein